MTSNRESAAPRLGAGAARRDGGRRRGRRRRRRGLPAALFARWLGNEVILLEKAPELGGTAKKAAFWYWVPNNAPMQAAGIEDPEDDFLRYMARLSRPQRYDPTSPTLGLSEWEYAQIRGDLRQRLARRRAAGRARTRCRTATARRCPTTGPSCPRTRRRPAACSCPRDARATMSDGGAGRHPHDERGGRARRRRRPHPHRVQRL